MKRHMLFVAFVVAACLAGSSLRGATLVVDLDGGADYTDIQSAIDAAEEGDEISVQAGEYVIVAPITFRGKSIAVVAPAGPEATVIRVSEAERARVVVFESGESRDAVLEGFTLTGGTKSRWREGSIFEAGGGVLCHDQSSPTIRRCKITGNSDGIFADGSSPFLEDCEISGNAEGGVGCWSSAWGMSLSLSGCTISGNGRAGIDTDDCDLRLERCTVSANLGTGLRLRRTRGTIAGCTISENTGEVGREPGGVELLWNSAPTFTDCVIQGNWSHYGSALYASDGASPVLVHCTITGNWAAMDPEYDWGSAVYAIGASVRLESCIVWGNMGGSIGYKETVAPDVSYSCVEGSQVWSGAGNINQDPIFCGWKGVPEVWVDGSQPGLGDGTPESPYSLLRSALEYDVAISSRSPCVGAGLGGGDMGVSSRPWDGEISPARTVHLAPGTYVVPTTGLIHGASLAGAGQGQTVIRGTVSCLRTGAVLSDLTVTAGLGIKIFYREEPHILRCTIADNDDSGVTCARGSPRLSDCRLLRNRTRWRGGGIYCRIGSPLLENCVVAENLGTGVHIENSAAAIVHCTIAGNVGGGIFLSSSAPVIGSSIVWGNRGESIGVEGGSGPQVDHSLIEGSEPWPGSGNINADPLFCGWTDGAEVHVDSSSPGPGDGTAESPFPDLGAALRRYSHTLAVDSPCIGTGMAGTNMGAETGTCGEVQASLLVRLAPGTYGVPKLGLTHGVSVEGSGADATSILGPVEDLRTGASLTRVTVTGSGSSGIRVAPGQSPAIFNCIIQGNSSPSGGGGVFCDEGSAPRLTGCTISGNSAAQGGAIFCRVGSSPVVTDCLVAGNSATHGGGVFCEGATPSFVNCTIAGNFALGVEGAADAESFGQGGAISAWDAAPTVTSSILWDNVGGSLYSGGASTPVVEYSCLEGEEVQPGTGNTNADPRFCGWGAAPEVYVDSASAPPGDGSMERPYLDLEAALEGFDLALSESSPCLHSGQDGSSMGARTGTCGGVASPARLVRLADGAYSVPPLGLVHKVSLEGRGVERTQIGELLGLRTRASLSHLTVTGGIGGAVVVARGDAPEIHDCSISGNEGGGIVCAPGSAPVVRDLTISGNVEGAGTAVVSVGARPTFSDCRFSGNEGFFSATLFFRSGSATILRCEVSDNTQHRAIHFESCEASVADLKVLRNTGDGIVCEGAASPTFMDCTISENRGSGVGASGDSSPSFLRSGILRNGSGVSSAGSASPSLEDCLISGSSSGGVYCAELASPRLIHCTIAGNGGMTWGGLFAGGNSAPSLESCIVWDNATGAIQVEEGSQVLVARSAVEGAGPWPGEGNIAVSPLFCGWPEPAEVHVDAMATEPGDGTNAHPYQDLAAALDGFSLALTPGSPCLGTGKDGSNMGADAGRCDTPPRPARLVRLAPGVYEGPGPLELLHNASLEGSGAGKTAIRGTVLGLRTGAILSRLTVTGGAGVRISRDEAPRILDCAISGNSSEYGGGVYSVGGSPLLVNCVISGNQAFYGAGVASIGRPSPVLVHCTVTGNRGLVECDRWGCWGGEGAGIYSNDSEPRILNCIVWGNPGGDALHGSVEASHSLVDSPEVWPGEGNIVADPLFDVPGRWEPTPDDQVFWVEGDYHLAPGSPAVDAGRESGAPQADIEGRVRPCGAGVDMGAYESGDCAAPVRFLRGDADASGGIDLTDAIFVLRYLFLGGSDPACHKAADASDDGAVNITDPILVLRFLFLGHAPPPEPYPGCGSDPTPDGVPCEAHPPCAG